MQFNYDNDTGMGKLINRGAIIPITDIDGEVMGEIADKYLQRVFLQLAAYDVTLGQLAESIKDSQVTKAKLLGMAALVKQLPGTADDIREDIDNKYPVYASMVASLVAIVATAYNRKYPETPYNISVIRYQLSDGEQSGCLAMCNTDKMREIMEEDGGTVTEVRGDTPNTAEVTFKSPTGKTSLSDIQGDPSLN
jgi:hypothetical protein